jgi:hypothetical protein
MNPYPGKNSVIILNNAKIHHDENLIEILEELGCHIIFLPPYSPDLNPIETAFGAVKNWIKRNCDFMNVHTDPIYALMIAFVLTSEMAANYFKGSIYF